ncbi:hypothetical protein BJX65DRAFT_273339 [Aspergillus insuetus]
MLGTTVHGDIHTYSPKRHRISGVLDPSVSSTAQPPSHQAANDSPTFSLINLHFGNNLDLFSGSRHCQPFESWPALVRPVGWV